MNPKERLFARMAGVPVDKIPNLNIVMLFAAQHAGIPYGKFTSDYHFLVEAQLKTAVDFGIDILSTMSDPFRETCDFGAPVRFVEDDLPVCEKSVLLDISDWQKLRKWDPMTSVRTLDRIRAVEMFKREMGEEYAILGWVEGAFAQLCDLATVGDGMMMVMDEPEEASKALRFIADQEIMCAKAQIAAGADIIGIGDAVASLISVDMYRELIMPTEKHIIDAVHQAGAKVKLHICGDITRLLPDMLSLGADIVDIDYMVDYAKTVALSGERSAVCGNLNPAGTLLQGSPDLVREQTMACVAQGDSRSIISSGCEVPRFTPPENVMAVHNTLKEVAG